MSVKIPFMNRSALLLTGAMFLVVAAAAGLIDGAALLLEKSDWPMQLFCPEAVSSESSTLL